MFHEAIKHRRIPWYWALVAALFPRPKPPWKHPWAAVCLFQK